MRQLYITFFLVLLWPAFVSADELRVLVSFEADEHRIEKIFKVVTSPVATQERARLSRSPDAVEITGLLLQWLDSSGGVLAEEVIADPRITHAPTHTQPIPDKLLKPNGVYLVNGPVQSEQLRLRFPPVKLSSQLIPASSLVFSLNPG